MHIADVSTFDGQADKRGGDALGDRRYIVSRLSIVGMEVGVEHEAPPAYELNAVNGNLPFAHEVEHLDQRPGVEAGFFGHRDRPCLR